MEFFPWLSAKIPVSRLSTSTGWVIVCLVIAISSLYLLSAIVGFRDLSLAVLILIPSLSGAIIASILFVLTSPPKFEPGRQGLLLAIRWETQEQRNRLTNDLLPAIERALANCSVDFQVLALQEFHASEVRSPEDASGYASRTGATLTLFGSLVERMHHGKNHIVLLTQGIAVHQPTTQENQALLSAEMTLFCHCMFV